MGEVTGVRWTRFGKDRLYVQDAHGSDVGWVDLLSGEAHHALPEYAEQVRILALQHGCVVPARPEAPPPTAALTEAGAHVFVASATAPIAVPVVADQVPAAPALEPESFDLSLNRPGQAARARAEEELAAMREKSRVGTWLARTLDVKTDERAWRVGADGEETVGAKLAKLTKHGWFVLHSVPVGKRGSDIDHVVIGPGGVFTVNTKKHPGKKVWVSKNSILVNGQRTDYLRNSRFEGGRAAKLLTAAAGFPVFVKPVLIFTTGTLIPDVTIKSKPDDVAILDRMDVPRAFKRSTVVMSTEDVEQVYAVARRSSTWLG